MPASMQVVLPVTIAKTAQARVPVLQGPSGGFRGAGFSLWGFVLAKTEPRRLKPALLKSPGA